jgi:Alpha/beta hydrolase domain
MDVRSVRAYRDGPFEWVAATASFAVDPVDQANARIVDLDSAPRDIDGRVRFVSDIRLLRPTTGGNGRALVVIPNRGMLGGVPFSLDTVPVLGPTEDPDPGDRFLLDQGWTIAWCGWQWDVQRDKGWLGLDAPIAEVDPGWMRIEFRPDVDQPEHRLSDSSDLFRFRDYPPADPLDPEAQLTVRTSPLGKKRPLPRQEWRLVDDSRVVLNGGFKAFHWYELVYRSAYAPVIGTGLLAVRDFSSWLRESYDRVLSFGISQSGRFLRQFLFDGLNVDEEGHPVFDGVFTHIASARRGEFNLRFGQPSLTHPLTPGYGPPYDNASLLSRQRRIGGAPKLFSTNSSWEYWRGDGALLHQDPDTGADLPEDPDTRTYLLNGSDHFGASELKSLLPVANPTHYLDASPVLRALFIQLDRWICDGATPPPSCVPRRSDGSAVSRDQVLRAFHNVALPDPAHLPVTPAIDPTTSSWPLELGAPRVALVSDVDEDGNETAGIRLPAVAEPVASFTGWNPRVSVDGLPDVLYEFVGSRLPIQSGRTAPGRSQYEQAVLSAAQRLVEARFLLEPDVPRTVAEAMRIYDELA